MRKVPDELRAEAQERARRLEAVLSTYGGVENAETANLRDMIRRAKAQARVPPTSERVKACEEFLVRASKRLQNAQDEVAKAVAKRDAMVTEISQARENLSRMRAEMAQDNPPAPVHPVQPDTETELQRLRGLVAQFERDRDARDHEDRNRSEVELAALRQEVEELRQFRDRFPANAMAGMEAETGFATERSTRMESLIEDASRTRNRFNPLA